MMSDNRKSFFIFFLMIVLSVSIFSINPVFGQDIIDLGLTGQLGNYYGDVYAVEVLDSEKVLYNGEKGVYYAFCATSKGMAVFSIFKDDNNLESQSARVSLKSLITIGYCTDIAIGKDGDRNIYAYLTGGEKGLYIIRIDHPESLYYMANIDTPGFAEGVALSRDGRLAFVADRFSGLQVIDTSNPNDPFIAGSCNTPGYAEGVALSRDGRFAFVAGGSNGLYVINISDPKDPFIVGSCDTPDYAYKVALSQDGQFAFVADKDSGLQVIDISDPNVPFIVGGCNTPSSARGVDLSEDGNYAFVANWGNGLQVIDISNPNAPLIIGSCDTPGYAYGVSISQDSQFAFVADEESGLIVIDISDPKGPYIGGSCDTPGYAIGVALSRDGQFAFVADWESGLQVIDISDPNVPFIAGSCDTPDSAIGIALSQDGQFAFVADEVSGLQVIDISNPNVPFIAGRCDTPGWAEGVALSRDGQFAFVADRRSGLQIIDISNPNVPFIAGKCDTPGWAEGVALSRDDKFAFVADWDSGLQVIDISNPNVPFIAGSCDTPSYANGVALSQDDKFAFVADGDMGLQVIDISNPNVPFIASGCDTPGFAEGVALSRDDQFAFVADGERGLQVIDISSPHGPFIARWCDTPHWAEGVALSRDGQFVFLAYGAGGLQVIDISNPNGPFIVGGRDVPGWAKEVVMSQEGQFAFVADWSTGLQIIDISNPNGPFIAGWCDTPDSARGVALSRDGQFAFVADGAGGLQVIDISDPNRPFIIGWCDTLGRAEGVALSLDGQFVFVADGFNGLQVINIRNPNGPFIASSCDTPGYAIEVTLSLDGQFVFVADRDSGLQVIDISDPNMPFIAGRCDTPGWAYGIALSRDGQFAFVTDGSGLQVIDISNPNGPFIAGGCDTPGPAYGVALSRGGQFAFVATGGSGLQVIDISNPNGPFIAGSCDTPGSARGVALSRDEQFAFVTDWNSGLLQFKINDYPSPKGSLILVAGGNIDYKTLYWHATQSIANKVFYTFIIQGYGFYDIYYFNPGSIRDINQDDIPDQLVVDDFDPNVTELKNIIAQFPEDHMTTNQGPLYLYLTGKGTKDTFQIMPFEVISAQEIKTSIDRFQNGYIDEEGIYHPGTNRPVVVIIESGASGSFIDDLAYPSNDPNTEDIIVITSTGSGPSYIKPSPDPNIDIPISFTRFLMDSIQHEGSLEDYWSSLTEAFIDAREQLYYTYGHPFLDQAPQMYLPEGPIALTFTPDDPNTSVDPLVITRREKIALHIVARYPDGTTITLDPRHLRFLSSQSLVFDPNDPNQMEITSDQILIHPEKNSIRNGLATFIAYPDPGFYPNILLTARLPLEVSIPGNTPAGGNKAIIVAGYRTNQGIPDYLWEETNTIANHAYKTLRKKGYSRDDIFYLNPYFFQDMDDNKRFDDIDGHPTIENLNRAFTEIADTGAQELLIFLVNHGSKGQFHINSCCEDLSAQLLGDSILSLAPSVKGNINILIDSCHSGSFTLPEDQLFLNQGEDPNDVILITSAGEDESAYFEVDGIVSFSYPFFDQYLLTSSIQEAFDHARFTIPLSGQTPSLYTPGRAQKRDKGLVYFVDDARPVITKTDYSRGEGELSLFVRVYSLSGIKRVWALILSSDQAPFVIDGSPRVDAPFIELSPDDPNAQYGGWYSAEEVDDPYPDAFSYQILLCAQDKNDKITTQKTNICNRNRDAAGAIILVTDPDVTELITDPGITEEDKEGLIRLFDGQSNQVYRVLKEKGVKEEDIYYLKVRGGYSEVVDGDPNLAIFKDGIPSWLEGKGYDTLLIYLLGQGNMVYPIGQGEEQPYASFCLNQKEDLSPEELAGYIQAKEGCRVIFFCDISYAWAFIKNLPLEDGWIGISSTKYRNWFKHKGDFLPLFSNLFFNEISSHSPFGQAYVKAVYETRICYQTRGWYQYPYIHSPDPFGGYEEIRKRLNFYIGSPNASGEDPHLIKTAHAWEDGENISVEIKVKGSVMILPPQAEFIIPSGGFKQVTLVQDTEDPSLWSCIQEKDQCYTKVFVLVQEADKNGQAGDSDWRKLSITRASQGSETDIYEEDDKPWQAWPVVVENPAQIHTFHTNEDTDWVYFFGHAGHQYDMRVNDSTTCRFIKLSLADPNGKILTSQTGVPIQSPFCNIRWQCPQDGYYLLKAEPASEYPGEGIGYTLSVDENREVSLPEENQATSHSEENQAASSAAILGRASIYGRVVNSKQKGINGVRVNLASSGQITGKAWTGSLQNIRGSTLYSSKSNGWYFIPGIEPGIYNLSLTEDDPNIILERVSNIHLEPDQIERIEDIILDFPDSEKDVVSEFELVYTQYQNAEGRNYPVWEDNDNDGLTNLEEFLDATDPDEPDMPPPIHWDMFLPNGWSMISVPLKPDSLFLSDLFPDAVAVYAYEKGLGYKRVRKTEALELGKGYWILLKEAKEYNLTGQPLYYYTLSVNGDGWEIIGGCTYEAQASANSCHIDVIYGYDQENGYQQVTGSEGSESSEGLEPVENPEAGEYPEYGEYTEHSENPESGEYQENRENVESGENPEPGEDLKRNEYLKPGKGYWILLNGIIDQCELRVEAD